MVFSNLKKIDHGFLRSRVSKRIFLLFILCALLPLTLLAFFSYNKVTDQLFHQAEKQLYQESKITGMAFLERIIFLENDLKEIIASNLARRDVNAGDFDLQGLLDRYKDRFRGLVFMNSSGQIIASSGDAQDFPVPSRDERMHMYFGNTLVKTHTKKGAPTRIFIAREFRPEKSVNGLLMAEILPDYFWSKDEFLPPMTDLVILDENRNVLFSSVAGQFPAREFDGAVLEHPASRQFTWTDHDEHHLAVYWTIFMRPQYLTNWTILYSQSSVNILEPLNSFRKIFLLVALLTFLVVLYLSLSLIRKNLIPLELLQAAIKKVKAKDYNSTVHIYTNDEFEELGSAFNEMAVSIKDHIDTITTINKIGTALSSEKNTDQLMNIILKGAMSIVNADAGFFYSINDEERFYPSLIYIRSLHSKKDTDNCKPDLLSHYFCNSRFSGLAENSLFKDETLNIPDIYNAEGLNFSCNIDFDRKTGYRSRSSLSVPMRDHDNKLIGILQLINARDRHTGESVPFSKEDQAIAENLASSAAVAMTNTKLLEDFKLLFDSLVELIATAIDKKSPYAGGHSRRVPELTMMIAETVNKAVDGAFKNVRMSNEELYELNIAALLHDCGKLTVPSHIENKSAKLENILDGMQILDAKFEVLKRDAEIEYLKENMRTLKNDGFSGLPELSSAVQKRIVQIEVDKNFLHVCNSGRIPMDEDAVKRLMEIAHSYTLKDVDGNENPIISEVELFYLSIPRGTITPEERKVINDHVEMSAKMLRSLHYPKHLRNVPIFAEMHHERMDGKGYPHGLKQDQIPLQGRIIAIADIFEALTAKDRPYKRRYTLMEALCILGSMKEEGHIDPDLFDIFIKEKIYHRYAEEHMLRDQIDEVVPSGITGYAPVSDEYADHPIGTGQTTDERESSKERKCGSGEAQRRKSEDPHPTIE